MGKLVATINMTLDGFCYHTAINPAIEIHQHYADLLNTAGAALYGRVTYQLMEYWPTLIKNPTGIKPTDEFAIAIDRIPKIVFSRTLTHVDWETAKLANRDIEAEVAALKQQFDKDILVCSPSLIVALTQLGLIDEYQLCIHSVIAGSGLPLFKNIHDKVMLKLIKTKQFDFGAIILYYEPLRQ